jgi:electron transfer flavoprotein alpha/beta subunit
LELELKTIDSELPVVVTIDQDNGIYTIRKSDTSGKVFNSAEDLVMWFQENMDPVLFASNMEYQHSVKWLNEQVSL